MNIGIDASFIHFPGVGRYIKCLVQGLQSLNLTEKVTIYSSVGQLANTGLETPRSFQVRNAPSRPLSLKAQFEWSNIVARDKIDLFHSTHYVHPLFLPKSVRHVITLHDAIYFRFPPKNILHRAFYEFFMHKAKQNADHIITVSQFSKIELCKAFGVDEDSISVVLNGLDPSFENARIPSSRNDQIESELDIPDKYFFYVGTNKPWKNVSFAISAFLDAANSLEETYFLIAGMSGANDRVIDLTVFPGRKTTPIRILGRVTEEQLIVLYRNAIATLVPSIYEGFGFPALEAMAAQCPVIASNAASIPEVVSNAALMANPNRKEEWVKAMIVLANDLGLRLRLMEEGKKRAKLFTAKRMGLETYKIYSSLS